MAITRFTKGTVLHSLAGGVGVFSGNGQIDSELQTLIDLAEAKDAQTAIDELDPDPKYLSDPERRRYLELAQFRPSDVVLEIGASKGQHTKHIARACKCIEALEVVPGQAVFAQLLCRQEGLTNVNLSCGGADGVLPYLDASFDVVIMNYVLEWCAGRSDRDPHSFHLGYLKECRRVLKPGGRFVIATKNRFSILIVAGARDEHLDMPFGSALPRPIGEYFRKRKPKDRLFGYLHSRNSFERLLGAAGFDDLEPFIALPDARYTKFLDRFAPSQLKCIRAKYVGINRRKLISVYLNLPFFMQRALAPSHVYTAKRPVDTLPY